MNKIMLAIAMMLGAVMSTAMAQEPGGHIGLNVGYIDLDNIDGSMAGGVNIGYAFNEIIGFDVEYAYKGGDVTGNIVSAFITLTTTGDTYFKAKLGGTTASGDLDGSSGSAGVGIGAKVSADWSLEFDVIKYSADATGASLLVKRNF